MTKNRTSTPVYLDPGMHPGLEVKGLRSCDNLFLLSRVFLRACLEVFYSLWWFFVCKVGTVYINHTNIVIGTGIFQNYFYATSYTIITYAYLNMSYAYIIIVK